MEIPEIKPTGEETYDDLLKERAILAEYIALQSQMQRGIVNYKGRDRYHVLNYSGVITKIMKKVYPAKSETGKPRGRKKAKLV